VPVVSRARSVLPDRCCLIVAARSNAASRYLRTLGVRLVPRACPNKHMGAGCPASLLCQEQRTGSGARGWRVILKNSSAREELTCVTAPHTVVL
jgi:hypothetical protein